MTKVDFSAVQAIIFDLDGTLIDSKKDLVRSVNATLLEMKREQLPEERISSYIGSGAPSLVGRAMGEGTPKEECERALKYFLAHYEEHKLDSTVAYPGVAETLEQLAPMPMAVLTNKPIKISVRILEGLKLAKYFRPVYGGNSFETKKPDPLGTNTILQELGIEAVKALFVGDSEVDVQTARNAGTMAAAVNYGFGTHDRESHPADVYLDGFAELLPLVKNRK
jgi:phosphoglycolate phosphatase